MSCKGLTGKAKADCQNAAKKRLAAKGGKVVGDIVGAGQKVGNFFKKFGRKTDSIVKSKIALKKNKMRLNKVRRQARKKSKNSYNPLD